MEPRRILRAARRVRGAVARRAGTEVDRLRSRRGRADLALFHEFAPSPSGGGHQFLRALTRELESRGLAIERNRVSGQTPACLFNSFNFDFERLRRFSDRGARMVHRVDGPIGAYRGFDDGTDTRIAEVNAELADATVFQSRYSLSKHRELGLELREPVVIPNAVDPAIFHPPRSRDPLGGRPVRVVAVSWSDNPRKGADVLRALGARADPRQLELTFVGRSPGDLTGWNVVTPLASDGLAELLRGQDVYVAPSFDDPCSNALLEALACGLPAAYRESGGHPELVGEAGLPFREDEELGDVLERLVGELEERRASISLHPLSWVADRYLEALGLRVDPLESAAVARHLPRGIRGITFRVGKRLDRAAVSRAHDVFYLSDAWTDATWLGAQALKNPLDLWVYQEIMFETRPEVVVETGTYRGGSAFFLASMCDLLGDGEVVSIDIEAVRDDYPSHPRITYLGGRSSTDPAVVAEVRARAAGRRTLVILDSDHSQAHVEAELAEYAPFVPVGGYVIVEDSNIGQIRKDLLPGPLEAIEAFLARTDEFEIDRAREKFLITHNPSGYLRRVR